MAGQVDEAVKTERLARLNALLVAQQKAFNAAMVGRTVAVLFEKPGRHPGQIQGRSPYLQGVHLTAPAELIGTIQPVHIVGASLNSLAGEVEPATADRAA